ncbi:MAG: DUF2868 domain-containing protein [Pseudomonadota bacterium]
MVSSFELGHMLKASKDSGEDGIDPAALAAAQSKQGNEGDKLDVYVRSHRDAAALSQAYETVARIQNWTRRAVLLLAVLLGGLAVSAALLRQETPALNIFWLLAALLVPATLSLLAWAVLFWRSAKAASPVSIAKITQALFERFSPPGDHAVAATQVMIRQNTTGTLGRWRLSVMSHSFWLLYLLSACAALFFIMAFQRYIFIWETTLLTPSQVLGLFDALRAPLASLGLPTPNADDIAQAQYAGGAVPQSQDSQVWAQFTLAALGLYALVPRLIFWGLTGFLARRAYSSQALSAADPFFADIAARIYQPRTQAKVIDPDSAAQSVPPNVPAETIESHDLKADMVIGWEVNDDRIEGITNAPLLGVFEREEELLSALKDRPSGAVSLILSLTNTPDRGTARILAAAKALAGSDISFVLIGQERLTERLSPTDQERRLADWWALLVKLGVSSDAITVHQRAPSALEVTE